MLIRIVFNYTEQIKSPDAARPGLNQAWYYINEVTSPFVATERDEYWGDGAGGEFLGYDTDPATTVIHSTAQHLAADRLTHDATFDVDPYQYWEYENCGGKNVSPARSKKILPQLDQQAKDKLLLRVPLMAGPMLKKQLSERKAAILRLKK